MYKNKTIAFCTALVILVSLSGCEATSNEEMVDAAAETELTSIIETTETEKSETEVSSISSDTEMLSNAESTTSEAESYSISSDTEIYSDTQKSEESTSESETSNDAETATIVTSETTEPTAESVTITVVDDEIYDETSNENNLTSTQRNSINMLNYLTVLIQDINGSNASRRFLDSSYSSLINNTHPNAVDATTQAHMNSILDTLNEYRMIAVKRERLDFIYEQNQAQAIRNAVPNPLGLLSAVKSQNLLQATASVLYMAVDSVSSYESASSQADMQYLKDGWELDDEETEELHKSRSNAFNYMLNMVREYGIPGDYALNEEAVQNFVEWKNNSNLTRKITYFESNMKTYEQFGPYWLELATDYYNNKDYEKCLDSIERYNEIKTRIFRKDFDYAQTLPLAILSAKETLRADKYFKIAKDYTSDIIENTDDSDWELRYFTAQVYLDLFSLSNNEEYLERAYQIVFNNVNYLIDEQHELNETYLTEIAQEKASKDATKRQKEEIKEYNKLIKEGRKKEVPPVSKALYLNCDLLFALSEKINISDDEKRKIDDILHGDDSKLFLNEILDNKFRFQKSYTEISSADVNVSFDGKRLSLPATYITDNSQISVIVSGENGATFDDWVIDEVDRNKSTDCSDFVVYLSSDTAKKYKNYQEGQQITIKIVPVAELPEQIIEFHFNAVKGKGFLGKSIKFERT